MRREKKLGIVAMSIAAEMMRVGNRNFSLVWQVDGNEEKNYTDGDRRKLRK